MYAFFFSSRRRHTRYWRDWSSDVCSSDLSSSESGEKASTKRVTTILYMIASSVDKPEGDSPVGMIAWWSVILSLSTEWRLRGVGSGSSFFWRRGGSSSQSFTPMDRLAFRGL